MAHSLYAVKCRVLNYADPEKLGDTAWNKIIVVPTYWNKEISVFFNNSITAADTDNDDETSSANH